MADEKRDAEDQHRIDTVPPPADGDGDAYSAPTRVGPVTSDEWNELIRKADAEEAAVISSSRPKTSQSPPSGGAGPASQSQPRAKSAPAEPFAEMPRVYDDADGDMDAATMLHPKSQPRPDVAERGELGMAEVPAPSPPLVAQVSTGDAAEPEVIDLVALEASQRRAARLSAALAVAAILVLLGCVLWAFSR